MFKALEKETDTMAKALPGNQTENRQELIAKLQQMSIKKVRKHALGSQNKVAQLSTKGLRRSNLEKEEDPDSSDSSDSSDDEDLKEELKEASKIVAKALPPDTGKKRQAQLQRLKKRLMEEAAVQGREMRESREIEPSQSKKEGKISKKIEPTKKFRAAAKEKENKEAETPQSKEETSKRISDLIKSMDVKIHKTVHPKDMMEDSGKRRGGGGGDRRKKFGQPRNAHGRSPMSTKHLYEGPALGIFTKDGAPLDHLVASEPNFFDSLEDEIHMEEIELPPMTAYQEMMQWTKQNKTWRFPIDNEWGMDEEAQVGFHEHVFLSHLITDFPKGPIRHYMELVATGLSKNPHMTVQEKHGHIEWYREYFADKQKLVDELIEADDVA
ncbi:hypothetical protein CAPTEDRAFT_160296 [Capitella teleta]|uniref:Small ribosomal subunit protein mS31 n=1 Tax=Capitella teleta TaxID=283909 RepID=R7VLF2_CAPTE|nr:hypothetical protein CAPTEDRAFT_160296 [Capitella teleta]|eukprot:ELU17585.1 hypothetical protein CAPTEDRAFT_160296 [Capitella teleta]